nr:hypothetical protein [Desulfobacterales bacterium]
MDRIISHKGEPIIAQHPILVNPKFRKPRLQAEYSHALHYSHLSGLGSEFTVARSQPLDTPFPIDKYSCFGIGDL